MEDTHIFLFLYHESDPLCFQFYVQFRFKGNFKLKWPLFACFAACSYVRNKKTKEILGFVHFLRTHWALFCRDRALLRPSFFRINFFKKSWALCSWCAHNIFISCHNPVSRTRTYFLTARSSLLSFVARYPLISTRCLPLFLLVAADFLLLAGLLSMYTAHGTSSCALVVARWLP